MVRILRRIPGWLVSGWAALCREIWDVFRWLLLVPLLVLVLYGLIYWGLTCLSGRALSIQGLVDHLLSLFSGGQILAAVLGGFVGFSLEKWRKATEAEKDRAERKRSALQELEQMSRALTEKQYREALSLYRLFRERCGTAGIWRDLGIWDEVRSVWANKSPQPLQTWVALIEEGRKPVAELSTLEALVWGYRLDPYNWEERGRTLVEQAIFSDTLKDLVDLFGKEPEARRSLLRSEIIGQRLEELKQSVPKEGEAFLETLQGWRNLPPLGMPHPWERTTRPAEPQGFVEWLQQRGLQENPFGPEIAEMDPRLADYGYWPPALDSARGPQPALVLGMPGSGRTAAALLLYWKCLFPEANPEEAEALPVLLRTDSWPQNPEDWLERLGRALAETLLQVCGRDPYAPFGTLETSAATAHLFARYFGPATEAHLRRQGLPESAVDYVLSEMEFHVSKFSGSTEDTTALWDLLGKARPVGRKSLYLILDVPGFRVSDEDLRLKSLAALMEMAGPLAHQGVYLKLFLPTNVGEPLQTLWPLTPVSLEWSEEDLREMLRLRLSRTSDGKVESLQQILHDLCPDSDYPSDLDTWLVRSAEGSPRCLVKLGNEMLRKAWEKSR